MPRRESRRSLASRFSSPPVFFGLIIFFLLCNHAASPPTGSGITSSRSNKSDTVETKGSPSSLPNGAQSADTVADLSRHVVEYTNHVRDRHDLSRLKRDSGLVRTACAHSRDMVTRGYFSHISPEQLAPADRAAWHHRRFIGQVTENIWANYGTLPDSLQEYARRIVTAWMNSPPHRKNILEPRVTHVGVCARRLGPMIRFTQVLAHVRAYLDAPLPHRLEPQQTVSVSTVPAPAHTGKAQKYAFWDPQTGHRAAGPFQLNDHLHIPDLQGTYQIRFYFSDPNGPQWYRGPSVEIIP